MLIEKILGNIKEIELNGKAIDEVYVDWFDVDKKILKKASKNGKDIGIKLEKPSRLNDGDILYSDEKEILIITIPECEAISIKPKTMHEMGKICYEIGNKHIPLFLDEDEIIVNYDDPLYKLLDKKGFKPKKTMRKLVNALEHHHHEH
ncbi:urease accessory protein [Clostridium acidisoli DSM 12555]|uniref:Urease accessory protein UreE n=1 Tax=Clostridium acidisoli DSM 12555 TaxID=1121291 RepID=A0A1W1XWL7_9CLOT|nr:urease accessory protein UreE [Clostridium acidisoli]SMC28234.1 urease accessory protein [Clostridium acidisoli DSM 12555]